MPPVLFVTYLSGIFDEVEAAVPGVQGLSFADDISWWAEGKDDNEVTAKLTAAATALVEWATANGVAFDSGKTEAALFRKRKGKSAATAEVRVGADTVPFNKEATSGLECGSTRSSHSKITMPSGQKTGAKR